MFRLDAIQRNVSVVKRILIVDIDFDVVKTIVISRNVGRRKIELEIISIRINVASEARVRADFDSGIKNFNDFVVDRKIKFEVLPFLDGISRIIGV